MPSSEPQVWSAINTRTSHHLMLLEKVLPFFKIVAFGHIHLSKCWGLFAGIASGFIEKFSHKSPLQSGKEGSNLLMIVPLSWMRCGTGPCCPHTSLFFNTPSIWLSRSKTFHQECGLHVCEKQWIIVQVSASQTSTGNHFFFIHDISC